MSQWPALPVQTSPSKAATATASAAEEINSIYAQLFMHLMPCRDVLCRTVPNLTTRNRSKVFKPHQSLKLS